MTIPASVPTALASLLTGVQAAYPLSQAPIQTLGALQGQANTIVVVLDGALLADDAGMVAPTFADPLTFANAVTALVATAQEETMLAELRALAGRTAINLANAGA